jgi:hypothetical protein
MAAEIHLRRIIETALSKEQRQKWFASIVLFVVGVLMSYYFFNQNAILTAMGLIFSVLGIRYIYLFFPLRAGRDFRLIYTLENQPQQIVWVYAIVTERLPFGLQFTSNATLYFRLLNGGEYSVVLPEKIVADISQALNLVLPHASFGYSKDREQLYIADPALLLQE